MSKKISHEPVLNAADESRQTKDDGIFAHLYAAIVGLQLEPGTKLPEDTLAETYGVSRTSIRKVLQKLAHKGLVDVRMNHGASVAQPTLKDARDLFASRQIVECGAIAYIVPKATPERLAELEAFLEQESQAESEGDRRRAIYLSGQFHLALARLADNEIISHFLGDLVARTSLVIATFGAPHSCGCPPSKHAEILPLLREQRGDEARVWMETHLKDVERSVVQEPSAAEPFDLKSVLSQFDSRAYQSLFPAGKTMTQKKRRP
ncbi:GntR family transcriptional regulator [Alcaligenes sp. WGS1538]|uniref:GntR family transcriptional regulator n=1 Tax=Alcaligenes sp. WGS1538 TaxID=3366811 RepID=UPI00372D60C7